MDTSSINIAFLEFTLFVRFSYFIIATSTKLLMCLTKRQNERIELNWIALIQLNIAAVYNAWSSFQHISHFKTKIKCCILVVVLFCVFTSPRTGPLQCSVTTHHPVQGHYNVLWQHITPYRAITMFCDNTSPCTGPLQCFVSTYYPVEGHYNVLWQHITQ